MKHKNLSLRRKTTVSQSTPADVVPKLVSLVVHLQSLHILHKFSFSNIIAMDETACWMDMPGDMTVYHSGARSISLKSTGHEKDISL